MDPINNKDNSGVVLDRESALEQLDGDAETLAMLLDLFRTDAPGVLETIRSALKESNAGAVRSTAHKIKGSLSVLGAPAAMHAALKLEAIGRSGNMQEAPAAFAVLEQELHRLYPELMQFGRDLRNPKSKT